jgi:SAM-dependent methyltransferase
VSIENLGESFDLIVCFETLEHINEQEQLMKVFKKLLRPEGLLIISTPDKLNYSDRSGYQNPFHLKELYEDDFKRLITSHFSYSTFYRQNFIQGSLLQPESHNGMMQFYQGNYTAIQAVANPVHYWLAIGSDVPIKEPGTSIFQNREFLNQVTEEDVNAIKSSLSYRLGHFLLTPFKWIRNLLR